MEEQENKFITLFKSRKFWASLIGILSAAGLYTAGEIEAQKLVEAILIIVATFVGGTAIEDGLSRRETSIVLPEVEVDELKEVEVRTA